MRETVRRFTSNKTHRADVDRTTAAVAFGAPYRRPPDGTVALCGVVISDGVVMQPGTKLKCRTCEIMEANGL